jgi:dTDP-4-dehydrorhamnose reductase
MRVLILGAGGMLGHKLVQILGDRFETWASARAPAAAYARYRLLPPERLVGGVDAADLDSLVRAIARARPAVVVNAVGIVKQLPEARDPVVSLTVNSLLPHRLAQLCDAAGARLIHLSTDCVFAGRRGGYVESDQPDAEDLYGRSKLLGEVGAPHLTLRTSIVGRELASRHGLLEWFLSNRGGRVQGYRRAIFSGFPTVVLARLIADLVERHPDLAGLRHLSAEPIDKDALLRLWRDAYDLPVEIEPFDGVAEDRSLDSTRFRAETGYQPPPWPELVAAMAEDPTPYDQWRRAHAT